MWLMAPELMCPYGCFSLLNRIKGVKCVSALSILGPCSCGRQARRPGFAKALRCCHHPALRTFRDVVDR